MWILAELNMVTDSRAGDQLLRLLTHCRDRPRRLKLAAHSGADWAQSSGVWHLVEAVGIGSESQL